MSNCSWCLKPFRATDIIQQDHIIPRSRGGPDATWNREALHAHCNREKGDAITYKAAHLAREHNITVTAPERLHQASKRINGNLNVDTRGLFGDLFRQRRGTR